MILSGKKAFTLAEVLITLSIIGVIASMTIPSLVQDVQDAQLKQAFKKAYSVATQSWMLVIAQNPNTYNARGGWNCTWPTGETTDYSYADGKANAFKAKFNVIKSCINEDGCWPANYEFPGYPLGQTGYTPKNFSFVTSDGMCWAFPWKNLDESHLVVDTNCNRGPNKIGKDIFSFLLGTNGAIYFACDDRSTNGKPVSSGNVCPWQNSPCTINGRSIDFKSWLMN